MRHLRVRAGAGRPAGRTLGLRRIGSAIGTPLLASIFYQVLHGNGHAAYHAAVADLRHHRQLHLL